MNNIRRISRPVLATAASIVLGLFSGLALAGDVKLSGANEVPAVSTAATGSGTITVADDGAVSGSVTTTGIQGTMAHIHIGAAGKNGRCRAVVDRVLRNECTYDACTSDADCKTGGPCECDLYRGNYCAAGNCKVDADCGAGGSCAESSSLECRGAREPSYYCRTPKDTCVDDGDCKPDHACVYSSQLGTFTCEEHPRCPVG